MPRPRKVSQSQLAKELGVSQALVSLVLNGRRLGINAETYDKVWAHAIKQGYHPKGMRPASSPTAVLQQVGFILRAPFRLSTPSVYFGHVQNGLHTALAAKNITTVYLGAEDQMDPPKLRQYFQVGHTFRGVVLLGEVSRTFLTEVRKVERRIVSVSAHYPGLCHSVAGNEPQALELLVRHLHGMDHRRIGWLGGNAGLGRHEARFSAFNAALKGVGLTLDPRATAILQQADRAEGAEAAETVLKRAPKKNFPTAFVCYNALMAAGAIRAFERAGLSVPSAISVASADISPVAMNEKPRITAAGSSPEKLGEAAARLLLESTGAEDESFTDIVLPAHLFVGGTTAAVQ